MSRLNVGNPEIKLGVRFKEDSGIARPEFYDWNEAIPKIFESNEVDIAIIMVGTNDAQAMSDGIERLEFGTPPWTALYSREVDRLINTLKQGGVAVYWVSLPPMAAPSYDAAITQIADIQKRQAEAASIRYVDIRPELTERRRQDAGARTGRHGRTFASCATMTAYSFMKVGNNKIGKLVLDVVELRYRAGAQQHALDDRIVQSGRGRRPSRTKSLLSAACSRRGSRSGRRRKVGCGPGGKTDLRLARRDHPAGAGKPCQAALQIWRSAAAGRWPVRRFQLYGIGMP